MIEPAFKINAKILSPTPIKLRDGSIYIDPIILRKDAVEILNYIESENGLIPMESEANLFAKIDFSLIEIYEDSPRPKLFSKKRGILKERVVLLVPGKEALITKFGVTGYMEKLMDLENVRFLPLNNFIINTKDRVIVTNDYRVVVKDHSGKIPQGIMLNIATVCYMVIGGLIDKEVGVSFIKQRMNGLGVSFLEYKVSGHMSVDLRTFDDNMQFKSSIKLLPKSPNL